MTPTNNRGERNNVYGAEEFVVNDGGSFTVSDTGAPWSRRLMSDTLRYQ